MASNVVAMAAIMVRFQLRKLSLVGSADMSALVARVSSFASMRLTVASMDWTRSSSAVTARSFLSSRSAMRSAGMDDIPSYTKRIKVFWFFFSKKNRFLHPFSAL
jgi:hypothetical protein